MKLLDEIESNTKQELTTRRLLRTRSHLLSYQAQNFMAVGKQRKAQEFLQQANDIAKRLKNREVEITNLLGQAAFFLDKENLTEANDTEARDLLKSAITLAKETKIPDLEWRAYYLLGNLLRRQRDLAAAEKAYQRAMQLVESLASEVRENELRMSFLANRYNLYRDVVTLLSSELNNQAAAFGYFEKSKAKMLLNQLASKTPRLATQIADFLADYSKVAELTQKSLPPDLVIVEYFISGEKALAFVLTSDSFDCLELAGTRENISALGTAFLAHLRNGNLHESKRTGKELYNLLILPLRVHLKPQSTLCVIPDANLFYIPFSALVTESDRYLIQEYRLTRAPSATLFNSCLNLDKGRIDGKSRKALIVSGDAKLYEAAKEAEAIYDYYKPYSVYLEQPSKEELARLVHRFEILHFVGHANLNAKGSPALIIASSKPGIGWNEGPLQTTKIRTALYGDDVLRWNVSNVRLVNLSACGTGLGKYLEGEGVAGLTNAFLAAGVPALLVSLWEVDGGASRALMERFYTRLQEHEMSKAEALRRAQMDMINTPGPYQAPSHWASFLLVGDPR